MLMFMIFRYMVFFQIFNFHVYNFSSILFYINIACFICLYWFNFYFKYCEGDVWYFDCYF